jgi:RNA polymerase sigma-70 factor (ECF subfamily)
VATVGRSDSVEGQPASAAAGLDAFVAEHYPRLIRLAALVGQSTDDAEDAVQLALERAWRNRAKLQDPERLRPWLDRIVVREAARVASRRRSGIRLVVPAPSPTYNPGDQWAALRTAFAQLTPEHRAVVVLHLYRGYTVPETANLLGVPTETVRSRLRHARGRLRHLLGEEE